MSSKRAGEELSFVIIKGVLNLLADLGRATRGKLKKSVAEQLDASMLRKLKAKGGEREIQRVIYYLDNRGYISRIVGEGDGAEFRLTTSGWRRLEDLKLEPLKKSGWDGMWRVLTFDIPEESRVARDVLRSLIKQLGFVKLHRSVWVQPWPCREQITAIQKAYGVEDHITLMEVTSFDQESHFKRIFAKQLARR